MTPTQARGGSLTPTSQPRRDAQMSYRVVYGETMPAWEKVFATKREADAFAKEHRSFGDIIFSVAKEARNG
jgi:hypothetical protein